MSELSEARRPRNQGLRRWVGVTASSVRRGEMTRDRAAQLMDEKRLPFAVICRVLCTENWSEK